MSRSFSAACTASSRSGRMMATTSFMPTSLLDVRPDRAADLVREQANQVAAQLRAVAAAEVEAVALHRRQVGVDGLEVRRRRAVARLAQLRPLRHQFARLDVL